MRTSEVLNTAADLIETRGWTQGTEGWAVTSDGPLCLEGAIGAAAGVGTINVSGATYYSSSRLRECPASDAVASYLDMTAGCRPYMFNDTTGRTAAKVIEVLRAAALIESAKEQSAAEATYAENLAVTA